MDVQFAPARIVDRDRQDFRLQSRAMTSLAGYPRHERANPVSRKLALGLRVKSFHLRHEPFKRPRRFRRSPVAPDFDLDRFVACSVVKRLLEFVRQLRERHRFVHAKMFHQRPLQIPVVGQHRLRPSPPRRDRSFLQRLLRVRHQLRIANELRPQAMTCRARAQVAVERKMFRRQLA